VSSPGLRLAEERDAPALAAIYAPAVTERPTSFEIVPPTAAEMARRLSAAASHFPWLVAERDGEVLGYAYGSRHRDRAAYGWSCDVSAYVRDVLHRQGIGRGLYGALLAILELQGFRRAFAGVTLPNPASVGLHEAMGFRRIGVYEAVGSKFGQWHDVAWFGRSLAPLVPDPPPPLTMDEVRALPAFSLALSWSSPC
jgi:L-amino acid N-acyltransferase YncA